VNSPRGSIIVLVGPTAVGKSGLALQLAEDVGGEILTADSRQVYRYMDIGTAKPSHLERARVPHHMIDLVEPSDAYSAQRFRREGDRVLRAIHARGRVAIVAGGTGFYIRALMDGGPVSSVPPDAELRARLRAVAEAEGNETLHRRLAAVDPASAGRIHPNNLPRLIRALEIVELTGAPVPLPRQEDALPALYIGLTRDRAALDTIADSRVLAQVGAGLVEETRDLLSMGYEPDSVALSGFAYREMTWYLQGACDLDRAIALYQLATRQYIRRQYTWFNADERITWFDVESQTDEVRSIVTKYLGESAALRV
jgi:tRNA dimethylallyltransferase